MRSWNASGQTLFRTGKRQVNKINEQVLINKRVNTLKVVWSSCNLHIVSNSPARKTLL